VNIKVVLITTGSHLAMTEYTYCVEGIGLFKAYVIVEGVASSSYSNYYYNLEGSRCSFRLAATAAPSCYTRTTPSLA
jgi:hypothetical protein